VKVIVIGERLEVLQVFSVAVFHAYIEVKFCRSG
jgi:hypothetical protein